MPILLPCADLSEWELLLQGRGARPESRWASEGANACGHILAWGHILAKGHAMPLTQREGRVRGPGCLRRQPAKTSDVFKSAGMPHEAS